MALKKKIDLKSSIIFRIFSEIRQNRENL